MSLFDESSNYDPMDKYVPHSGTSADSMGLGSTMVHGAVAAVADIGTTMWNTLTPDKYNYSTQDFLSRVDNDALQVYNEHTDTVQAASFVGGMFLPIGVSLKLLGMARNGVKGTGFFTTLGQQSRLTAVESAFEGAGESSVYNAARNAVYRGMAANAVIDNVVIETAILGTMSAHPYMEDYYKDFSTNFLKSVAFGTALQGGIGTIISKYEMGNLTGKVQKEAQDIAYQAIFKPLSDAALSARSHTGTVIGAHLQNIDNLKTLIQVAKDTPELIRGEGLSPYTLKYLERTALDQEAKVVTALKGSAEGELSHYLDNAPTEELQRFLTFLRRPENAGADTLSFQIPEGFGTAGRKAVETEDSLPLTKAYYPKPGSPDYKIDPITGVQVPTRVDARDVVWVPTAREGQGAYVPKSAYGRYGTVADFGVTVDDLLSHAEGEFIGHNLNPDWSMAMAGTHTSEVDADFAKAFLAVNGWEDSKLAEAAVAPDHLPLLKAMLAKALQREAETGVPLKLNIKLAKTMPAWNTLQTAFMVKQTGVDKNYVKRLKELNLNWDQFSVYHPRGGTHLSSVDSASERLISSWVGGSKEFLRLGAAGFRDHTIVDFTRLRLSAQAESEMIQKTLEAKTAFERIYNSTASQALRSRLSQEAIDGKVWLYRGLYGEPDGHAALESYTLVAEKAREFGGQGIDAVKMYAVDIDDIVVGFHDIGGSNSKGKLHSEILALSPTRDFQKVDATYGVPTSVTIPSKGMLETLQKQVQATPHTIISSTDDLAAHVKSIQEQTIEELKTDGFGADTIALKTGSSYNSILGYLTHKTPDSAGWLRYSSVDDVEAAVGVENRSLKIGADISKIPQPEQFAFLNTNKLDIMSEKLLEQTYMTSKNPILQDMASSLLSPFMKELAKQLSIGISSITSTQMKSSLFTNANKVLEAFGPVGVYATELGKTSIRVKNEIFKSFEEPISMLMENILRKGDAHLIDMNTALNVNASIVGRRIYKDGQFFLIDQNIKPEVFAEMRGASGADLKALVKQPDSGVTIAKFKDQTYTAATAEARDLLEKLQDYGRTMYDLKNGNAIALGRTAIPDIGFWTPSFNPRDKSLAYVYDRVNKTVSMLFADTDAELRTGVKRYEDSLLGQYGKNWQEKIQIVEKSAQEDFNILASRHDALYMGIADVNKQKGGSATAAIVPVNTTIFKDILGGYQHHVHNAVENTVEILMNQTMNQLQSISKISQEGYNDKSAGIIKALSSKPIDPGQTLRNIILGRPLLSQHKTWSELQQRGQVITDSVLKKVSELIDPVIAPVVGKLSGAKTRTAEDWFNVQREMKKLGIVNPFEELDQTLRVRQYLDQSLGTREGLTPKAIVLGNALAGTFLLKVGEIAQPFVNAISLPILTSAAVNRKLASSFLGVEVDPMAKFTLARTMHDGMRLSNHPTEKLAIDAIGQKQKLFDNSIQNVTEMMEMQRSLDPGLITIAEKTIESLTTETGKLGWTSWASNISESWVRRQSFFTGISMARQAYPKLGLEGQAIFAKNFMDEVVGNYTSAQRPAMFQGTFGVGLGLFQTYLLTLAQGMYRQIEHKNWASLGKMMLTQSTIFGASSLPGFHLVSEQIAKNFSDQRIDLETGTFRAIPDPAANMLLYGLPSSFGPGITTRGDIQPRVPNPFQGVQSLALVNMATQAYTATERIASATFHADENAGRAMLEAISLQSISRPIARISELVSGRSLTGSGDIVAQGQEIYSTQGVISRLMSTRPLEEIKAREAMQLNNVYGSFDADKRKAVISRLKSHIRNGDLSDNTLENLSGEYLRTGSTTGWRSAVNHAVKEEWQSGSQTTMDKLRPNSPLHMMFDDLD